VFLQIDDGGIVDVEATIAVLPEEYQAKADPIIRKCGTKSESTSWVLDVGALIIIVRFQLGSMPAITPF
jgi:hypothetical protein